MLPAEATVAGRSPLPHTEGTVGMNHRNDSLSSKDSGLDNPERPRQSHTLGSIRGFSDSEEGRHEFSFFPPSSGHNFNHPRGCKHHTNASNSNRGGAGGHTDVCSRSANPRFRQQGKNWPLPPSNFSGASSAGAARAASPWVISSSGLASSSSSSRQGRFSPSTSSQLAGSEDRSYNMILSLLSNVAPPPPGSSATASQGNDQGSERFGRPTEAKNVEEEDGILAVATSKICKPGQPPSKSWSFGESTASTRASPSTALSRMGSTLNKTISTVPTAEGQLTAFANVSRSSSIDYNSKSCGAAIGASTCASAPWTSNEGRLPMAPPATLREFPHQFAADETEFPTLRNPQQQDGQFFNFGLWTPESAAAISATASAPEFVDKQMAACQHHSHLSPVVTPIQQLQQSSLPLNCRPSAAEMSQLFAKDAQLAAATMASYDLTKTLSEQYASTSVQGIVSAGIMQKGTPPGQGLQGWQNEEYGTEFSSMLPSLEGQNRGADAQVLTDGAVEHQSRVEDDGNVSHDEEQQLADTIRLLSGLDMETLSTLFLHHLIETETAPSPIAENCEVTGMGEKEKGECGAAASSFVDDALRLLEEDFASPDFCTAKAFEDFVWQSMQDSGSTATPGSPESPEAPESPETALSG